MSNRFSAASERVVPYLEKTSFSLLSDEKEPAFSPPDIPRAAFVRFGDLYGASEVMQDLFHMIARVAPTRANVLISGESGTGKELVAAALHQMGKEKGRPFVALNCGAISPQLIEAELFGHERGSFTGAVRMHKGCFERANGGTLFLDELTEMPSEMQVKLLRVLETGRFSRVGGGEEIQVSVRIIAATNRNPLAEVEAGRLRNDLFYRLAVFPLHVPPLSERSEDIELLAKLFLSQLNQEDGTCKTIAKSSWRTLKDYQWPGNVRELKNAVQRAFILADQELQISVADHALKPLTVSDDDCVVLPLGSPLAEAEEQLIYATLDYCNGNKTHTAEVLGVSLKTLYNRLNGYQSKSPNHEEVGIPQAAVGGKSR